MVTFGISERMCYLAHDRAPARVFGQDAICGASRPCIASQISRQSKHLVLACRLV